MKNQKGFSPVEIILIAFLIVTVGFAAWRIIDANNDDSPSSQTVTQTEGSSGIETNDSSTSVEDFDTEQSQQEIAVDIPEGWIEYTDDKYGFSFIHPQEWGTVIVLDNYVVPNIEGEDNEFYFVRTFSNLDDVSFGAPLKVYPDELGRGGSLLDYTEFSGEPGAFSATALFSDRTFRLSPDLSTEQSFEYPYEYIDEEKTGIVSYGRGFFGPNELTAVRHAIYNLNRSELPAFNFAVNDPNKVSIEEFRILVESFREQ